jgi:hypothetical protein
MSYKNASTKQSQDNRDRFDHLTHPVTLLLRVLGDPGFRVASSGPKNVFRSAAQAKTGHPPHLITAQRARGASVSRRQSRACDLRTGKSGPRAVALSGESAPPALNWGGQVQDSERGFLNRKS